MDSLRTKTVTVLYLTKGGQIKKLDIFFLVGLVFLSLLFSILYLLSYSFLFTSFFSNSVNRSDSWRSRLSGIFSFIGSICRFRFFLCLSYSCFLFFSLSVYCLLGSISVLYTLIGLTTFYDFSISCECRLHYV